MHWGIQGFGGEWLERHEANESVSLIEYAYKKGINIIDCWMSEPRSRDLIGRAIRSHRDKWYVQGHIGPTYQNGQYVRSRDPKYVGCGGCETRCPFDVAIADRMADTARLFGC